MFSGLSIYKFHDGSTDDHGTLRRGAGSDRHASFYPSRPAALKPAHVRETPSAQKHAERRASFKWWDSPAREGRELSLTAEQPVGKRFLPVKVRGLSGVDSGSASLTKAATKSGPPAPQLYTLGRRQSVARVAGEAPVSTFLGYRTTATQGLVKGTKQRGTGSDIEDTVVTASGDDIPVPVVSPSCSSS